MNTSHILLLGIVWIVFLLIFNTLYLLLCESVLDMPIKKEHINNDLPDNQITQEGDDNLLIPTSNQVYNPYDTNRPANQYGHQETDINSSNSDLVNTDISIPIVYSLDEIEDTSEPLRTPTVSKMLDTGSGPIIPINNINNNVLNNFRSIE